MKIGFIGVGAIGYPMAERLLPHHDVTVFDVNQARARELAGKGGTAAATAAEAATGAEVVIVMVATPEQLVSAVFDESGAAAGMAAGSVLLVMSSVGIDSVQATAEAVQERGIRVVDAPVTGGVVRAITGELTILLGGDAADIERVQPVLTHLGAKFPICGNRIGDGQAVKVVNQLLCSVHLAAAGEALALAGSLGLDPAAVLETVGSGAAASFMLNDRGPRMLQSDPDVLSAIDIFVKDSQLVQDAAAAVNSPTPVLDAAATRFQTAQASGLGRDDDSAVYRTYTAVVTQA